MSAVARLIRFEELEELLHLYTQLHPEEPIPEDTSSILNMWTQIYHDPNLYYIVVEVDGEIVSTCNISIIKNLTRNLSPYGLIENVVTDMNYRNKGYGRMALQLAIEIAQENECYKVMLMTGSKKEETLRFYESVGFRRDLKMGFVLNL